MGAAGLRCAPSFFCPEPDRLAYLVYQIFYECEDLENLYGFGVWKDMGG
jgi:hypothetical protein